ncbi:Sensor histidine kinase RcsC [Paraburkholderia caffeinitolerans]|uniref:Virulence sensor protein BvgS n=1 Tax=Paraburkholderia caffeinitolerans TaxID=1723730 RepID=A0A6J5GEM8_9BURK|nr:ATP-binding protein [Paraburkholderia caffeinitolerans]CAB3797356.1 Sensor histidine kinase RcsC [Paraburkholderia caffeinitolerans]
MRRPLRRMLHVLIWIAALAPPVVAVGYLLYANLLNPNVVQRLTGNYDGLYWDAAQMQIAYARFESQLLIYADGLDRDLDKVRLRYEVLQSKLNVMKGSTRELAGKADLMRRQHDDLAAIDAAIEPFDAEIDTLAENPERAVPILMALDTHWTQVTDLALNRRFADVTEREDLRRDFIAKRRDLFAAGLVLLMLSAAAAVLLVLNGYRRTRLIRQQHAALEAEAQASRAAREASMAKDAFLGMISHELRTPLHAIVSSIELLGFNSHSEADSKVIQRLETAARQLEAQMKDLTDYARLGAGKLELRQEAFDVRELLQSIVDENEQAAFARGLAFEHACHGPHQALVADPHRIRQIANNLVTNAIRYTERGSVRIEFVTGGASPDGMPPSVATRAQMLAIIVSDTGPGVSAAQIPLIFKEFTQLDTSRSRRYEGAGMGLAIVRGLVDLFGGTIDTDSRVGRGTTFTVMIPVAAVTAPLAEVAAPQPHDKAQQQVLVVDDNPLVRESLCEMVAHMGYAALAAADTDSALARLDEAQCEVVLLDLHMPGRDGYAFVAELQAREGAGEGEGESERISSGERTRVIAVSADVAALAATAADSSNPFFDLLPKPVHYEVLRKTLLRAFNARRLPGVAGAASAAGQPMRQTQRPAQDVSAEGMGRGVRLD